MCTSVDRLCIITKSGVFCSTQRRLSLYSCFVFIGLDEQDVLRIKLFMQLKKMESIECVWLPAWSNTTVGWHTILIKKSINILVLISLAQTAQSVQWDWSQKCWRAVLSSPLPNSTEIHLYSNKHGSSLLKQSGIFTLQSMKCTSSNK